MEELFDGAPIIEGGDGADTCADTGAENGGERLYAGKYKTVDDLEKAYKELNSHSTKKSQELAELKRSTTQPRSLEIPDNVTPEDRETIGFVQEIAGTVASQQMADLLNKVEQMQIESYLDKLQASNPEEYEIIAPEIVSVLTENPALMEQQNYLELATKLAKANKMEELVASAAAEARNSAYDSLGDKTARSSLGTRTSARKTGEKDPAQAIIDDIMSAGRPSLTGN